MGKPSPRLLVDFFFVLYAPYLLIVNVVRFSCNLKEMKLEYSNLDILMADVDDSWFCNITIERQFYFKTICVEMC